MGSHDHWADRRSLTFGLLLFLSWVPIYLFYTTSTDLLDDISRRETKYASDEHILFYEAFDSLTPMVTRAEIILNWFVLIKFTLIIIAVKGTIEPPVALEGWHLGRPRAWSISKKIIWDGCCYHNRFLTRVLLLQLFQCLCFKWEISNLDYFFLHFTLDYVATILWFSNPLARFSNSQLNR